ncbi:GntR family transcriptional regulator [Sphingomonas sp. PP-CE-3A-406]|uniref:GntR family transcriptional regulator n=1 Tax=unclassified Sphingomonas TaxID=196159 RepID=UPI00071562C2|nr:MULTISPECIES: GntR family transcriptional regulator [unclassified Sphingomonas]KQO09055.1 GntR family transcriptional regulator [Sphingomonas sp. Leaf242]RMB54926.1 GntR family transcriptional regulator [Sphingomonas sp. PP-CE-3A-406]
MAFIDLLDVTAATSSGPRYLWLQGLIRTAIETRRLAAGTALPSERELCDEFQLSRVTIRKALEALVTDGLLERRRGAGTFVSRSPGVQDASRVEKNFSALSSFSEDMLARGRRPSSEWIDRSEGSVTPEEALALGLSPGSHVFRFQRIRFADDETMAVEYATVPSWGLKRLDDVVSSLYGALAANGNRPVRALQRVRAICFGKEHAVLLGIEERDPGLMIERRSFAADGRVIEVTHSYYRGDAYDLVAELHHS